MGGIQKYVINLKYGWNTEVSLIRDQFKIQNIFRFISFPKEERRGHNNIYLSDNLASAVKSFTELDCTSKK